MIFSVVTASFMMVPLRARRFVFRRPGADRLTRAALLFTGIFFTAYSIPAKAADTPTNLLAATDEPAAALPTPAPPITRELLSNGVTLLVAPDTTSNVVGMEVVSRIGTRYEPAGLEGLANLTLQVMMRGTSAPNSDLQNTGGAAKGAGGAAKGAGGAAPSSAAGPVETAAEWFEDRGASLNVQAHPDFSEIGSAVMAADFPGMARRLAAMTIHPDLSTEAFRAEQEQTLQIIGASAGDEKAAAYQSLRVLLADGSAYGRSENGLITTVGAIKLENVNQFYHEMFAGRQIVVAISGNVRASEAINLCRTLFSAMSTVAAPPEPTPIHTRVREPASMVIAGNGDEAWIMLGYLTPGIEAQDYPAVAVLNAIIGGANSGKINTLFREQSGIYDSGSFVQPFALQAHIVGYVRADPLLWNQQDQKMRSVVDNLYQKLASVFSEIQAHGVTPEEVEFGKQFVIGQYLRGEQHNRTRAAYLAWYEAIGLGAGFNSSFPREVAGVTAEQVNGVARSYLQTQDGAAVMALPRPRAEGS